MVYTSVQYINMIDSVFGYLLEADTHIDRTIKHQGKEHEDYPTMQEIKELVSKALIATSTLQDKIGLPER